MEIIDENRVKLYPYINLDNQKESSLAICPTNKKNKFMGIYSNKISNMTYTIDVNPENNICNATCKTEIKICGNYNTPCLLSDGSFLNFHKFNNGNSNKDCPIYGDILKDNTLTNI
jgi:hypothetical protein